MDSNVFWTLIEDTTAKGNPYDYLEELKDRLVEMGEEEIFSFYEIFNVYFDFSYGDKLWAASHIINSGSNDDGFDNFRAGLIARGKEVYTAALEDPDSLAEYIDGDELECESLLSLAQEAYFELKGDIKDYNDFHDNLKAYKLSQSEMDKLIDGIVVAEDMDVAWQEEDLPDILPRLAEVYDFEER